MPREYVLKTSPIDGNRIKKIAKQLVDDAKEDRDLTLEAYRFFKELAEENPADNVAKTQMGALLKILQSTHSKTVDAINALLKYEDLQLKRERTDAVKGSDDSIYDILRKDA
jgi:hypothetical protein|tara:strand:- start:565 stop:900 length:336 start_codon:yes stop_codon:yes gene_type:complete